MTTALKSNMKLRIRFILADGFDHKVNALAAGAGIAETMETCPVTRGLIRDLIDEGQLIGSSVNGYRMLTTGKEVQQHLNALLRRQMGISKRIQSVYDAAVKTGVL